MKEARIECLTSRLLLPDLGRNLKRGDAFFLPATDASSSKDLQHALQNKAVKVDMVERFQVEKPAPRQNLPPFVRRSTKNMGGMYRLPNAVASPVAKAPPVVEEQPVVEEPKAVLLPTPPSQAVEEEEEEFVIEETKQKKKAGRPKKSA